MDVCCHFTAVHVNLLAYVNELVWFCLSVVDGRVFSVYVRRYASAVRAVIVSFRPSICLSVCPPQIGVLSKRLYL